jgi:hypothetical protein
LNAGTAVKKGNKPYFMLLVWILISGLILNNVGCAKEYSIEFHPVIPDSLLITDTTIIRDSLPNVPDAETNCSNCDSLEANQQFYWTFRVGRRKLCGTIAESYTNTEKNGFTFYGPSTCAADSGLMINAYFQPVSLLEDKTNVVAHRANFQYFGLVANNQYLSSWIPHKFNVVIDQYILETNVAIGRFSGYAFVFSGDSIAVGSGKFKVKFGN